MSRSRLLLVLVGLVVSAAAIVLLVRSIDVAQAVHALRRASPGWFAAGLLVTLVVYYLRSLRWRALLEPHARPPVARLFRINMVGFLAVNVFPARLGELVRAYALARSERISTATVIGSVAVERILDLGFLGVFWSLSLLFAPFPDWFRWSGYVTIGVTLAVGAGLWGLYAARGRAIGFRTALLRILPAALRGHASGLASGFGAGLEILGRPGRLAEAVGWSAAIWLMSGLVFLTVGMSLGLSLPVWSVFLLTFVVCVGISLPSSSGFIGVMEWACILGLALVGVKGPAALAFALLYHLIQLAPVLVLGTTFAIRDHLSPSRLAQLTPAARPPGEKSDDTENEAAGAANSVKLF